MRKNSLQHTYIHLSKLSLLLLLIVFFFGFSFSSTNAAVLKKPSNNLGLVSYWKLGVDGRQGAGELNANWDMEDGVTPEWAFDAKSNGVRANETTDVYRGAVSARLTNSTVSSIAFWDDGHSTQDGELYLYSVWAKDVDVPNTPYFSDANATRRESAPYMSGSYFSTLSTDSWTHFWAVYEATNTTIDPYIRVQPDGSQGDFLIDDFSVQKLQAADSSGYGNHGDLVNSIALDEGYRGDSNGGFSFNRASSEYIEIPDSTDWDFGTGDFTVSFWFKTDESSRMHALDFGGNDGTNFSFDFEDGSYGVWVYWMGGGSNRVRTTNAYNDNEWHHLLVRRDGTDVELFIDNVSVDTATDSTDIDVSGSTYIGSANGSNYFWDGGLDEIRVYNRALSNAEVQGLYNLGKTNIGTKKYLSDISGLTHWYTFDGSDVDTDSVFDVVGGVDGVMVNDSYVTQGIIGQGMYFADATGDKVDLDSSIEIGDIDWTVSAWVKTSSSGTQSILSNQEGGPVSNALRIVSGKIAYYHYDGSWNTESGSIDVDDGEWHHFVWANDGDTETMDMYVDGVLDASGVDSSVTNAGPVNRLGSDWGTNSLTGTLDDVRIYRNKTLTADEIQRIYNATRPSTVNKTLKTDSLAEDLIAHWSFDGGDVDLSATSAEVRDASGSGYHGDAQSDAEPAIGVVGQAYTFDGSGDHIDMGDIDLQYDEFSVSAWAKSPTNSTPAHVTNIVGKGNWNSANNHWFLAYKNGSAISFVYGLGSWSWGAEYATSSYDLSQWNHYVGVADASSHKLYVNGELVDTVVTAHSQPTNSYPLEIGRSSYINRYFEGKIDDVRIYNRALTANEVQRLYNMGQ